MMTSEQPTVSDAAEKLPRIEGYLTSDPGNLDLLALAIELSLTVGDVARARRHADAALARYPDDLFFRSRMATVLMAQHAWSLAAAHLEAVIHSHAEVGIAYNLAYCYTWLGRHRDAYDCLSVYAAQAPLAPHAVTLLVRNLHHLGELEPATALVQAEMERCQADPAFLGQASLLYFDNGQVEKSERLSAMCLVHGARPTDALVVAASLALGRTDTEVAIKLFNEVLAKNPSEGRSWSGLGLASMLNRDLPTASQQLEQAVTYMPGHVGTWHILGWCKILSQDLEGARDVFLKTIEIDRNFGDSHGGLAVVLAMKGEREIAEESIKRALGLDPQSLSARFAQMVLAGKVNDPFKFRALAGRMLSAYKGPFGASLDVMLAEYEAR